MKKWQLLGILLLAASCMPDSLTKFKEEPVKKEKAAASTTKTTTLPDGTVVTVPAASGTESAPTSFTYSTTEIVAYLNESMTASTTTPTPAGSYTAGFYFSADATGCGSPGTAIVATTFPSDLTLNATTGTISGTPTSFLGRRAYYIKMQHIPTGTIRCKTIFITKLTKITGFQYLHGNGDNLVIKLSTLGDITDLTVNPFYSTDYVADPRYIVTDFGTIAQINFVDWTLKKLYVSVTNSDDTYDLSNPEFNQFDINDKVDVGDSTDLGVTTPFYFVNRATISEITQVFSTIKDFRTAALVRRIPVTDPYIAPSFVSTNEWSSLVFSIGPNIDTDTTIDFNKQSVTMTSLYGGELKSTAVVSAVAPLNAKSETNYIVTIKDVTNANIAGSYKFSIVTPPQNFGLTRWQLLKIDDATKFNLGDKISSSGDVSVGTVRQVVSRATSNHFILVEVEKGVFAVTNSIDNVKPYYGEKTIVRASYPVNAVVKTGDNSFWTAAPTSGVPATQRYFSTLANAEGIVQYVVNDGAGDNFMYLMITSGSLSVGVVGEEIYDVDANSGSINSTIIREIDSPEAILTVASATNYEVGMEVTTINGAIGVVNKISGSNLYVTNQLHMQSCSLAANTSVVACDAAGGVWSLNSYAPDADGDTVIDVATDDIDNLHYYAASDTTITAVQTANAFNLYRGENITVQPQLYKGDSVTYQLIGTLPIGLTFDSTSGKISGTPTDFSATSSYTVRAFNAATNFASGAPSMTFDLKVFEFFEMLNTTTNATSFIMHKEGQNRLRSRCLITQEQIDGTAMGPKDINCFLEAGELDLYNSGLALKADVGKGMCEHVRYAPYYFYKHQYKKSAPTTAASTLPLVSRAYYKLAGDFTNPVCQNVTYNPNVAANTNSYEFFDSISTAYVEKGTCASDYATLFDDTDYPNCDDGKLLKRDIAFLFIAANCSGTATSCASFGAAGPCAAQAGCTWGGTCTGTPTACSTFAVGTCAAQTGCAWNVDSCTVTPAATTTTTDCGGDIKNCVEGPAKETSGINPPYTTSVISAADNGFNTTWTYSSPLSKSFYTNIYLANYTSSNKCDDTNLDGTSGNDYAYKSTYWGDHATNSYSSLLTTYSDPFMRVNPFYTLYCLDAAFDVVARIRVLTREWNKDFKATSRIDLANPGATFMDNTTIDPFGSNYNNRADWDNSATSVSLPGTCSAPGAGADGLINTTPNPDTSNFTTPFPFPELGL